MARTGTGSSSNYMSNASAVITAVPLTFACWFRSTDITAQQALITVCDSPGSNWFVLEIAGNVAGDPVRCQAHNTGKVTGETFAATSTGYSSGVWHHACGVFASTTSRTAYIDGGSSGSDTALSTPGSLNQSSLAAFRASGSGTFSPLTGRIAHAAIWNVALTAAEVARLPFVRHDRFRLDALVAFWEVWGLSSPEPDTHPGPAAATRYPMTITGTLAQSDHAPVIPYSRRSWVSAPHEFAAADVYATTHRLLASPTAGTTWRLAPA